MVIFQSDVTESEGKSINFNLSQRLGPLAKKLLAARPKPLKYREIVADGIGIMDPDPRTSGV